MSYLSATSDHNSTHRYIPQSPHPHSPPQTPSPSSPTAKTVLDAESGPLPTPPHTAESIMSGPPASADVPSPAAPADVPHPSVDDNRPHRTPEDYSYNAPNLDKPNPSAAHAPLESPSLAGMGISFPANTNPLPTELHSPDRPTAGAAPVHSTGGGGQISRVKSSDGNASSQSQSPGPYPTTLSAGSLHPTSTPARSRPVSPRPVSPRPHGTDAHTSGTFASSSSIGFGGPRERVFSPNKQDLSDGHSHAHTNGGEYDYSSAEVGAGSANPYDPSHAHGYRNGPGAQWGPAGSAFSAYGFPLTGSGASKDSLLGNSPTVHPTKVPFKDSVAYWLGLYFCFNLGLTLFNKFVLVSFPFPYTLTGLHALSGCAGTYIALERGSFTPARLTQKENVVLAAFSVLYTINIAVSNISLQLVSIPFHQVVRASTPLFTIFISAIFLRTRFSALKLVSLLPVVAGVGFATYGDYDFTALGLILTLLGTFLAALKTVVTNLIQTGGGGRLKLHPLDLLMRMSPLAFIQCVIYGWYTGELERVRRFGATQMTRSKAIALLLNGIFAFGLNIVSFTANKKAGALTMTVSANCKQVLTIVLAVMLFNLHISPTNGLGILLTLVGGGWYGYVEYAEKKKKAKVLERALS